MGKTLCAPEPSFQLGPFPTWASMGTCVWSPDPYTKERWHGSRCFFYYIFSSFTFQMLSRKSPIPFPHPAPQPTHSHFLALVFPCTGAYNLRKTKGLSSHWWPTRTSSATYTTRGTALGGKVLVSLYYCSSYRVADPFSSLGTFSSSFIGGPVFHQIDDCEHPLLYLPGTIGRRGPWSCKDYMPQ